MTDVKTCETNIVFLKEYIEECREQIREWRSSLLSNDTSYILGMNFDQRNEYLQKYLFIEKLKVVKLSDYEYEIFVVEQKDVSAVQEVYKTYFPEFSVTDDSFTCNCCYLPVNIVRVELKDRNAIAKEITAQIEKIQQERQAIDDRLQRLEIDRFRVLSAISEN